jgi:ATP-dependent DNA helicase RecQ
MIIDLATALRTYFGFDSFRPGQAEAIESLLAGRDTLAVMPTGSGKSLIYQLSALQRPGLTLVISPLIALMKDQVDSLTRRGIPATYINSTLSADEQASRLSAAADGRVRLLYVAPERLRNVRLAEALRRTSIGLLAVDEAHCISQWGHDFRPDYLHIAEASKQMGSPVTVALTATATPQVQDDIIRQLDLRSARRVVTGFNRPNLTFEVLSTVDDEAKLRELQRLIGNLTSGASIIYVGTRRDTEQVAEFVATLGVDARYYHAGLDGASRSSVQEAFIAGDLQVVVATNAFGMGIDRPDVRLVIHYNLPGTLEAYYQEAGRAGRDGDPARAVLLYATRDRALQEFFIENDAPASNELRSLYNALGNGAKVSATDVWIGSDDLAIATGLPDVKIRVGLEQLESAGVIERLGDDGLRMLVRRKAWNAAATSAATAVVEQRRRHRRQQLDAMIGYAEANTCRRRILLNYFGDPAPAEADVCCDNCEAARTAPAQPADGQNAAPLPDAARTVLVILDTLRRMKWEVGLEKLAQTLKGSKRKEMQQFGYDQSVYYGRLAVFSQAEIEDLIGQVIGLGLLKHVGGNRPVLRLTPQGQAALKARSAVPLNLPRPIDKKQVEHKRAQREAGGTVELTAQMFAQGLSPAQIAGQRMLSEETIYNHLAQKIALGTIALERVIPAGVITQVQETIARVGIIDRLAPLKAELPESISYSEIRCVVEAWKKEHGVTPAASGSSSAERSQHVDPVADFLSRPHPRPLIGSWQEGWALGFHSGFGGADWKRSPVGDLTYRLKYESDATAVQPLVDQALAVCKEHPALVSVDGLVAVPPSVSRSFDPVHVFVTALAACSGAPAINALVKTRQTAPQKDMHTQVQKKANVAGAFAVKADVHGKRLLVIDDLYDSGATLEEITRVLRLAGAASVCILTLTRTIHSDA